MNEIEWILGIKTFLEKALGKEVYVDILQKIPYAHEILSYNTNFEINESTTNSFETDLLVYEKIDDIIKPRVIIEAKIDRVTTGDAYIFSNKAQLYKNITPFIRYGIMLGNQKTCPLPGRLFKHASNFDFMISFKEFELDQYEEYAFINLIKQEIFYSKQIEEMIYSNDLEDRQQYFILEKKLRLVKFKDSDVDLDPYD